MKGAKNDAYGRRWLIVIMATVSAAWIVFSWLSYRVIEPYVTGTAVTVWVSVILGFLSLWGVVFVCVCVVAFGCAMLPKRTFGEVDGQR